VAIDKNRRRIDVVTEPAFIEGIRDISLDELRERRKLCDALDTELSYYRRLLHGRMDILAFEMRRRRGEESRSLIEALPDILAGAEAQGPATTSGRVLPVTVPDLPDDGKRIIDRVLGDDFLARLPSIEDEDLEQIQEVLTGTELDVSEQRRRVYEAYEMLQAELTRRYRDGLADVDELLRRT
jgi:hypothetical protein